MGFMGMFGSKKSGTAEGDWGSDQVGMMKMLAGMPHMMRKPMMKGRINQLLTLSEQRRQESVRDMIGAFHSPQVKDKARHSLVATRVEIIGELPENDRRTIIAPGRRRSRSRRTWTRQTTRYRNRFSPRFPRTPATASPPPGRRSGRTRLAS